MSNDKLISVDAEIFNLTNESETIEGFAFKNDNVRIVNHGEMISEINNDAVLNFLNCPTTKVYIKVDEYDTEHTTKIIAHNFVAHETIEITKLGDHILAMNEILLQAKNKRKELKVNPDAEIISNEMIQNLNGLLLRKKLGEVGIGKYRDVDYYGKPCHVQVASMDHGSLIPIKEWQPVPGGNGNVPRLMDKLVNWVNSDEFRQMDPLLRAVKFHSTFIHIHPFRDGNGRTGRMLLNYMLSISGLRLTNIIAADSEEYFKANAEAIVNKNYKPLMDIVKKHQIRYSRELYAAVVKYNKERERKLTLLGCQVDEFNNN